MREQESANCDNQYYEVVDSLKHKDKRLHAQADLAGGIGAMATRGKVIPPDKLAALIWGLKHSSPVVRRCVLEILDNQPDDSAVPYIAEALDDPVPRVRWHAVHALTCEVCKDGHSNLTPEVYKRIEQIAHNDPSPRVRSAAEHALNRNGRAHVNDTRI